MSVLHAPRRPEVDRRLYWFPTLILPLLGVLGLKLWYFQVVASPQLVDEAAKVGKSIVPKLAPRGTIFDRRGKILAGVQGQLVVTIRPYEAKKHPEVVTKLSELLQMPPEEIEDRIKEEAWRNRPAPIKAGISIETATKIAESSDLFGVEIDEKPMRHYADTKAYAHVLGYVWTPVNTDEDRLKALGIVPADYIGKVGLERAYEKELMGQPGKDITEGSKKARFQTEEPAIPGKQLHLSIDASLQEFSQRIFANLGFKGAVVAIDPKSGEILAMISSPTFDTNLYVGGISTENYKRLTNDPAKPGINRAIGGIYAPGSTFKILTSIAAYEEGKLTQSTYVYCDGAYHFSSGKKMRCMSTHGSVGFNDALTKSCNTYFSTLAVNTGQEGMIKAALECGFGEKTGVELGGEIPGIIPTPEWRKRDPKARPFYVGSLAQMGIGQGYVAATPIQMANLMAMVANRGVQFKPHFLHAIRDPLTQQTTYVQPEIIHTVKAEDWFWDMLQNSLCNVIDYGTAQRAKIDGVTWGGKTGSAEHGRNKEESLTHSWFVGFAPKLNPKIAICVIGEAVGHGGDFAAPIAGDIVKHYLLSASKASANVAASRSGSNPGESPNRR